MSLSAQQYNRLRGPALTVLIIDKVRHHTAQGQELSTRQLAKQLASEAQLNQPEHFNALYYRVKVAVRSLADAGLITTTSTFHPAHRVNITLITLSPCSASTAK
jgi:hypothetical protein